MPTPSEPVYHDFRLLPAKWRAAFREATTTVATIVGWETFWWVVRHFTISFH